MPSKQEVQVREPSPPLGSWGRMYALVIGADIAIIILLTLFTRHFS